MFRNFLITISLLAVEWDGWTEPCRQHHCLGCSPLHPLMKQKERSARLKTQGQQTFSYKFPPLV